MSNLIGWSRRIAGKVGAIVTGAAFIGGLLLTAELSIAQESLLVASEANQRADQEIRAQLRQPISVDFQEKPLTEVAHKLARSLSFNVYLDNKVLSDAGIDPATLPITAQLHHVSAESALSTILSAQGLTWCISDESVVITTKEQADSEIRTRVYLARDLVATGATDINGDDADPLIDLITGTVATETWSELGGPGTLEYFHNAGALVVSQTRDVHDKIEKLLASLRKARGLQGLRPVVERGIFPSQADLVQYNPAKRSYSLRQSWNRPQVHR